MGEAYNWVVSICLKMAKSVTLLNLLFAMTTFFIQFLPSSCRGLCSSRFHPCGSILPSSSTKHLSYAPCCSSAPICTCVGSNRCFCDVNPPPNDRDPEVYVQPFCGLLHHPCGLHHLPCCDSSPICNCLDKKGYRCACFALPKFGYYDFSQISEGNFIPAAENLLERKEEETNFVELTVGEEDEGSGEIDIFDQLI